MPIPIDPLPPGLEGQGYAAGAFVPQPPAVGALRPNVTVVPTTFSPMDLVARARDRFMNLFRPPEATALRPAALPMDNRTAQLEKELDVLERRSTTPSVKDLRLNQVIADARR